MGRAIKQRAATLLEMLLITLIGALIAAMIFQQMTTLLAGQSMDMDTNLASTQTRQSLDAVADHLRNADACSVSASGTVDSVLDLTNTNATSVTYYGDTTCTKVRYFLTSGTLSRTDNNVTTIIVRNVTSLTFKYYKAATYNAAWSLTTDPSAPTATELPSVCGILMDITTSSNGVSNRIQTTVRLRNAPKKTNLSGL